VNVQETLVIHTESVLGHPEYVLGHRISIGTPQACYACGVCWHKGRHHRPAQADCNTAKARCNAFMSVTHCNNSNDTLQQHTATTHTATTHTATTHRNNTCIPSCCNTLQQHTATTHCNNTLQQHTLQQHTATIPAYRCVVAVCGVLLQCAVCCLYTKQPLVH